MFFAYVFLWLILIISFIVLIPVSLKRINIYKAEDLSCELKEARDSPLKRLHFRLSFCASFAAITLCLFYFFKV